MTVTPLSSRTHRTPLPTSPRGRRGLARRRRVALAGGSADPGALIVTFEITLAGESRYGDALEILDTLRAVTDRLGSATLDVRPAVGAEDAFTDPYGEVFVAAPAPQAMPAQTDDGSIQVMPESRSVIVAGKQISLTRVEFDLLLFLAEHPRRVFGRTQLLKNVWGYEQTGERTVDVHIRRLRAKLGDSLVATVRGVGYRLAEEARVRVVRLR
jgi:two-component system OmpR family response regulator